MAPLVPFSNILDTLRFKVLELRFKVLELIFNDAFITAFVIFVVNTLPDKYIFGLCSIFPITRLDVLLFPKYKV